MNLIYYNIEDYEQFYKKNNIIYRKKNMFIYCPVIYLFIYV